MLTAQRNLDELDGPLLLFGGPYSNLQATEAMRSRAEQLGIPPERIICTGDSIAYCADPTATLELLRDWGIHLIKGNCEDSLASGADDCGCGFATGTLCSLLSDDWYRFALGKIDAEQRAWLGQLPERIDLQLAGRRITVLHGGLEQLNQFIFASTPAAEKNRQLDLAQSDIVIGGHSGIPFGQQLGRRAWLNSGAIGMPANDGSRAGWYLLLQAETDRLQANWQRLTYQAETAAASMRRQGLEGGYQKTLLSGLWPSQDVLPEVERQQQGKPLVLPPLWL